MRLPGDDGQKSTGFSLAPMVVGVSAFVLILLFAVMKSNSNQGGGSEYVQNAMQKQQEEAEAVQETEEDETEPERKLRAEDLGFWDMYPVEEEGDTQGTLSDAQGRTPDKNDSDISEKNENEKVKAEEIVQEDPALDGKHTLVKAADGTEEWVLINPYLKKNSYDFNNLSETSNLRKYTENGKKISQVGVDISKHSGAVNFKSMKSAGIDFVIIRLGARGYGTGQISLDDNYVEHMEAAIEAGLGIGVYFYSQAINQEEAVQEANFVIQNLEAYKAHISYPVAFDMENVANDQARIDGLSREDKTTIAVAFLDGVQAAGYIPMVYGNKEWLIKNVDLSKLQNYDVWLSEDQAIPDYPYLYTMWQYTTTGTVNGVSGDANLNLCFVNYSDR
ncbi:MAG: glycoside hydrolase family 25 protein [Blautia sp.]|nr:glycoside hydrolase family 25 protein [Blautia sp.]